jgi:hypothetical protein
LRFGISEMLIATAALAILFGFGGIDTRAGADRDGLRCLSRRCGIALPHEEVVQLLSIDFAGKCEPESLSSGRVGLAI